MTTIAGPDLALEMVTQKAGPCCTIGGGRLFGVKARTVMPHRQPAESTWWQLYFSSSVWLALSFKQRLPLIFRMSWGGRSRIACCKSECENQALATSPCESTLRNISAYSYLPMQLYNTRIMVSTMGSSTRYPPIAETEAFVGGFLASSCLSSLDDCADGAVSGSSSEYPLVESLSRPLHD